MLILATLWYLGYLWGMKPNKPKFVRSLLLKEKVFLTVNVKGRRA